MFVSTSSDLVRFLHLFDFLRGLVPSRLMQRLEEVFARRLRSIDLSRDGRRSFGERKMMDDCVEVAILRRRRVEGLTRPSLMNSGDVDLLSNLFR